MKVRVSIFIIACLCCFAGLIMLSGCASDDRRIASDDYYDNGSHADPAAYVVDRFQVHHEDVQKKKGSSAPFYFKRCSPAGERYFYSRTSYDCVYPF